MPSYQESYVKNNPNLKRRNLNITFTEEQVVEFIKCQEDPIYFIENYIKIVTQDFGLEKMSLYPFQKNIIDTIEGNQLTIVKAPRQVGKSTVIAAYVVWRIIFYDNFKVGIFAHVQKTAMEIMDRIRTAYENVPKWLQHGIISWNKGSIELENGSSAGASATSEKSGRGFSYNFVLMDEFAHINSNIADNFIKAVFPAISRGKTTKLVVVSTPKGFNAYHDLWEKANNKTNSFIAVDVPWNAIPGRDANFKKKIIADFGEQFWRQEYECVFLGSNYTLIEPDVLAKMKPKRAIKYYDNDALRIYEEPEEGHAYFMAVDCSEGKDLDYHAFTVIDITRKPFKVVAVYYDNKLLPQLFADVIARIGKYFNEAAVLIETQSTGTMVSYILFHELEYPQVLGTENAGRAGQRLVGYKEKCVGIQTSKLTKKIGCSNLKMLIESNNLNFTDEDIIYEFKNFVLTGDTTDSYAADPDNNDAGDDLVMTLVIFGWAVDQQYFQNLSNVKLRSTIEDKISQIEETLAPFGYIIESDQYHNDEDDKQFLDWMNDNYNKKIKAGIKEKEEEAKQKVEEVINERNRKLQEHLDDMHKLLWQY